MRESRLTQRVAPTHFRHALDVQRRPRTGTGVRGWPAFRGHKARISSRKTVLAGALHGRANAYHGSALPTELRGRVRASAWRRSVARVASRPMDDGVLSRRLWHGFAALQALLGEHAG